MGAFLRQMVEVHTEMTTLLVAIAKRRTNVRYPRQQNRSDGEVVMSDLAATISDLSIASSRVIERQPAKRAP